MLPCGGEWSAGGGQGQEGLRGEPAAGAAGQGGAGGQHCARGEGGLHVHREGTRPPGTHGTILIIRAVDLHSFSLGRSGSGREKLNNNNRKKARKLVIFVILLKFVK